MIKVLTIQNHIFRIDNGKPKFLVLKRKSNTKYYPGMWQVVTGRIEKNEKPEEAAIREAKEETENDIITLWHIPHIGQFYDPKIGAIQNIPIFASELKDNKIILSKEHTDFKWLNYEEVFDYLVLPSHIEGHNLLKKYILNKDNSNFFKILI